jgi:hypothetical protein
MHPWTSSLILAVEGFPRSHREYGTRIVYMSHEANRGKQTQMITGALNVESGRLPAALCGIRERNPAPHRAVHCS